MNEGAIPNPLLREVIDALPGSVVVTDPTGTIVLWNRFAEELFGWAESEVVGRPVTDVLLPAQDEDAPEVSLDALLAGESSSVERTVRRRDGTTVPVLAATRALLSRDGEIEYIVAASEDLTQRRLLDQLRTAQARTAGVDARLAGLGWQLAAAGDLDQVLAVIAKDAGEVMDADAVAIGLIHDAEHVELVRGTGASAQVTTRIDIEGRSAMARAVRTRERQYVEGRGDEPDEVAPDAGSLIASPLFDADHHPIGVLVFSWLAEREFDDFDRTAIETLSRLCGQAVRRAETSGYTNQLADLAAAMAAARTSTEVARLLRDHSAAALGASLANLRLLDAATGRLRNVVDSNVPTAIAKEFEVVHISERLPLSDAARLEAPVWLPDLGDYAARYPGVVAAARAAGLGASAALPLHESDGTVSGAVTFGWDAAVRFDTPLRGRLATLCELAGQTLERVRLYETEHVLITTLQRQLLTPLPDIGGLELAAVYEPAAAAVGMGGDWYEAIPVGEASVVAVLGDVVGHGVGAVAAMARLQHHLSGLIRTGSPLGDVFARANAMAPAAEPIFATCLLLHVDVAKSRLGVLSAGHPWPLVRTPDGRVRPLTGGRQPMLGADIRPGALEYVDFPTGSLVMAFTDGLIERRDEPIKASIDRLVGHLEAVEADASAAEVLDRLMAAAARDRTDSSTSDDVAALIVRSTD